MTEPSEAAMREALKIILAAPKTYYGTDEEQLAIDFALALDRHAAAQRERDAKIADGLYQYQWRKDEYIYRGNVAAAIRSATP